VLPESRIDKACLILKVRRIGLRDRYGVDIEVIGIAVGADGFLNWGGLRLGQDLTRVPWRCEGAGILDVDIYVDGIFVRHTKTLDDVQLVGVRRAVIVDEAQRVVEQRNGIDDQRIAFVVADGFAVPAGLWVFRMRHIQIDVPRLIIAAPDDQNFFGRLDEKDHRRRNAAEDIPRGNARRIASLPGGEGNDAGQHLVIRALHLLDHPRLENGIGEIGNAVVRIARSEVAHAIGSIGMIGVRHHRAGPAAFGGKEIVAVPPVRKPRNVGIRREVRDRRARSLRKRAKGNDDGADYASAIEVAAS